jgi:hypothetical protein
VPLCTFYRNVLRSYMHRPGGRMHQSTKGLSAAKASPTKGSDRSGRGAGRRFTLIASGDVLPHGPVLERARAYGQRVGQPYDFRPMFADLRPILARPDLALCHLEVPLSHTGQHISPWPAFNAPPQVARALRWAGYDACSTASNHSMDQGPARGSPRSWRSWTRPGWVTPARPALPTKPTAAPSWRSAGCGSSPELYLRAEQRVAPLRPAVAGQADRARPHHQGRAGRSGGRGPVRGRAVALGPGIPVQPDSAPAPGGTGCPTRRPAAVPAAPRTACWSR